MTWPYLAAILAETDEDGPIGERLADLREEAEREGALDPEGAAMTALLYELQFMMQRTQAQVDAAALGVVRGAKARGRSFTRVAQLC